MCDGAGDPARRVASRLNGADQRTAWTSTPSTSPRSGTSSKWRDRQGPGRRVHRPRAELPPERPPGRVTLQGAHAAVADAQSGAMRWDVLRPWLPFGDRFVLSAGHTVPLDLLDAGRAQRGFPRRARSATGDARFAFPDDGKWALTWEHAAQAAPPRRPPRPCRDGRQDALPQVQHRAVAATAWARPSARRWR